MRILELITPSRIGGAETQVAVITHELTALGDDVTVFCPAGRPLVEYLQRQAITPVTWRTQGKFDPLTLYRLVALIKERRIDMVHTHLTTATFLGTLAARLAGVPCVATMHGLGSVGWYRATGTLIAVCGRVRQHLLDRGLPPRAVHLVYNGIPVARYRPTAPAEAKRAVGADPAVPRVGIVGRLSPEKGHALALRAWPAVLQQRPDAVLTLIGDGKERAALEAQAAALGLGAHVEFRGFVADPRPLLAACDLLLVPSSREGVCQAAMEAMALARPVVATTAGGLPEVVRHGDTGLLVPPDDPNALATAVLTLLADPRRAEQYGQSGRRRAERCFNAPTQVARLRDLFTTLVERDLVPETVQSS